MFIRKLHIRRYRQTDKRAWLGLDAIAQATTELAILGTIMLLIFGALLRYGISYNAQQETQMYAFRKALTLAKMRREGNMNGQKQFASVNLNVMTTAYKPADAPDAQSEPISASGSAAIMAETTPSNFGNSEGAEDINDAGGAYYQIGEKMIANNQYIEPAYMKVKRRVNHDKMPRTLWQGVWDFLSHNRDEVISFEPVPYWEQEQNTNTTYDSQYATSESQDRADYNHVATTHTVTETRFKPQPFDRLQQWDTDIIQIYDPSWPQDMVVNTDQTFTKTRTWESQK